MLELNKIIQGDCLQVMKEIPDKSIDLVLTDPPYGVNLEYDKFNDTEENVAKLINQFMPEALRIAKTVVITPGVRGINWYPKPTWVLAWVNSAGAGRSPWGFSCWQPILVYGKDPFLAQGLGGRSDLIKDNSPGVKHGHPCSKPVSLMEKIIDRTDHNGNGIILDPFCGSGSTLVACKQLKRNFIGIEISQKYCDIANQRLRQNILL
jgi:site-specific DNA-methyltransferase (adenine-specific)